MENDEIDSQDRQIEKSFKDLKQGKRFVPENYDREIMNSHQEQLISDNSDDKFSSEIRTERFKQDIQTDQNQTMIQKCKHRSRCFYPDNFDWKRPRTDQTAEGVIKLPEVNKIIKGVEKVNSSSLSPGSRSQVSKEQPKRLGPLNPIPSLSIISSIKPTPSKLHSQTVIENSMIDMTNSRDVGTAQKVKIRRNKPTPE